jgi:anti-sigma-K factor RskA
VLSLWTAGMLECDGRCRRGAGGPEAATSPSSVPNDGSKTLPPKTLIISPARHTLRAGGVIKGNFMRFVSFAALAALLVACSPPASNQQSEAPQAPETPIVAACNNVQPDMTQAVTLGDETARPPLSPICAGGA